MSVVILVRAAAATSVALLLLGGCRNAPTPQTGDAGREGAADSRPGTRSGAPTSEPDRSSAPEPRTRLASDGRPRRASLTIPAVGVRSLVVVPYRGSPDDAPGTRIQNRGLAASPFGPRGGVGPGGVGNYIVTAHRTSSTRAFSELPRLTVGQRVHVVVGRTRYVYRVTGTRSTSFRSARSLARQSAAVPGHPGRRPTRAMITLSTCATQEDHARGNYWSDRFGNPEHRIDKIGVLVSVLPA